METEKSISFYNVSLEKEVALEGIFLDELSRAEDLESVACSMNKIVSLTEQSQNLQTFAKIENCVKFVKENPEKELKIRQYIITRVVENIFPLFNSKAKQGEIVELQRVNNLANDFGELIVNEPNPNDFVEICGKGFIETVILR